MVMKVEISDQPREATNELSTTLQDQAYEFVKGRIMNLDLKPGQYITDSQVVKEMEVSRTPVREALRRLEQEGLLIDQGRRGWKVYALSLEDIHDIFDLKEAIEGMIARRAAQCRDDGLRAALRATTEAMQRAAEIGDVDAWYEADAKLHGVICEMAGNERATRMIENLNVQWHRVRIGFLAMQGRITRSNPEHEAFVEGILSGDGDRAEHLIRSHLNNLRKELVNLLVNLVLPFVQEGV